MRISSLLLCLLVLGVLGGTVATLYLLHHARQNRIRFNERKAEEALWWLSNAELTFHARDLDSNGVHDYWTEDVAGLNYLGTPAGGSGPSASIHLIPRDLTIADAAYRGRIPEVTRPYCGYFFQAMEVDSTGAPYQQDTDGSRRKVHHLSKFAFCAFPAEYGVTGRETIWITERRSVVHMLDNGGEPILKCPP